MSHQEMRDENKEAEGSPEMRAARRQRQRDIATGSVSGAMREAQFVVTNPTHFAVAMTYDPAKASAPIVLAKGRGDKAMAMKELAREMDLPMLELPQLARSVYYTTAGICEDLYGGRIGAGLYLLAQARRNAACARGRSARGAALRHEGRLAVNPQPVSYHNDEYFGFLDRLRCVGSGVDMTGLAEQLAVAQFAGRNERLTLQSETLERRISLAGSIRSAFDPASALGDRLRTGDLHRRRRSVPGCRRGDPIGTIGKGPSSRCAAGAQPGLEQSGLRERDRHGRVVR